MDPLRVFLIDTGPTTKEALEQVPLKPTTPDWEITLMPPGNGKEPINHSDVSCDVVLIGEKVARTKAIEHSEKFRSVGVLCPILLLTNESEAKIPSTMADAGVDDILQLADINTPLFPWTFMSTMRQIIERRKAVEYNYMKQRCHTVKESLATFTHDMNNPLSVMRLAVYHLENSKLSREKTEFFYKLLIDNVEKIEDKMKDLYAIRRLLMTDRIIRETISHY